ncbi:MAG TPA: hypothetical protein VLA84_12085 [Microcoleus sp.]|nr:hypothetical protein [Microcoleus sp.]
MNTSSRGATNTRTCSSVSETTSDRNIGTTPEFSGTVTYVGENGFGVRSVLGNGGSGAVCDALLWESIHTKSYPIKNPPTGSRFNAAVN